MNERLLCDTDRASAQGPISEDMLPYLRRLSELVPSLPDNSIREARLALQGLFDCQARIASLEGEGAPQ